MRNIIQKIFILMMLAILFAAGCGNTNENYKPASSSAVVNVAEIPAYSGKPYIVLNNNVPGFAEKDLKDKSFEYYSDLDSLGRCGMVIANVGQDIMPKEKRGSISSVKPSGWVQKQYDFVDGKSLYNRCHLIGWQLSAENANEKNLITGTRYLNVQGMLPFENMVADYVKETGNHVLYRVTPVFKGSNLVADGVQIEAMSVEDKGESICFNVFCYNVQPGVEIDYATGKSRLAYDEKNKNKNSDSELKNASYILNTKSKKIHRINCSGIENMDKNNRKEYTGTKAELEKQGYTACGICKP